MAILFGSPSMITSTDNKSQQELMQEFDAVFSGLSISPDPKNPTAYRGDRDLVIITLPSEIKTSLVLTDLGRLLGERYLLILSSFYVRGLLKKKTTGNLGNFLQAHHKSLRQLGGEHYPKLMKYGLSAQHLVKSPLGYQKEKRSFAYMLNQEVFSLKTQQRYTLTTKHAKRVRLDFIQWRRREFIKDNLVRQKIADSIDGLRFNYSEAIKYVSSLPDVEPQKHRVDPKTYRRNLIEQYIAGETDWSVDPQGRNYTLIVSAPRDIRCYFSHVAGPLWVVDISSSQPLLHVLLYPCDSDEKKKYQTIVESGDFWDFMNNAAGKPFDLNDPENKKEMKEKIYREVFFSYPKPNAGAKKIFAVIFKREFPVLWSLLNAHKLQQKRKPAAPLAKAMQQTEAEAVSDAVSSLKGSPCPLITIHDAIVTTKEGLSGVCTALKQSFSTLGLQPSLAEKKLTA